LKFEILYFAEFLRLLIDGFTRKFKLIQVKLKYLSFLEFLRLLVDTKEKKTCEVLFSLGNLFQIDI
jgi:hypothetical protein